MYRDVGTRHQAAVPRSSAYGHPLCGVLLEMYFNCEKSDQAQTVADIFKRSDGSTTREKFDSFIHTIGDVLCGQGLE